MSTTNTYTWTINALDCYPTSPQPDCVFLVHWTYVATSSTVDTQTNKPYTSSMYGTTSITYNPNDPYIPYANLTPIVVEGWLEEVLVPSGDLEQMKSGLDAQINNQIAPPVVQPPLPWVSN